VAPTFDGKSASGTFDNPAEREQAFLDAHQTPGRGRFFNHYLRYREAVIEVGETIDLRRRDSRARSDRAPGGVVSRRCADAPAHDELAAVSAADQRRSRHDRVACDCACDCDSGCDRATWVHAT
jgi:hypothetical protein